MLTQSIEEFTLREIEVGADVEGVLSVNRRRFQVTRCRGGRFAYQGVALHILKQQRGGVPLSDYSKAFGGEDYVMAGVFSNVKRHSGPVSSDDPGLGMAGRLGRSKNHMHQGIGAKANAEGAVMGLKIDTIRGSGVIHDGIRFYGRLPAHQWDEAQQRTRKQIGTRHFHVAQCDCGISATAYELRGRFDRKTRFYELLFTASLLDLANRISETSRIAPMTMALSATLKSGQL